MAVVGGSHCSADPAITSGLRTASMSPMTASRTIRVLLVLTRRLGSPVLDHRL